MHVQNWIGGSDYTPRGAVYVPPPPETVANYMADLVEFVGRDDMPALLQAALAHAQFESIHPFTDGNGRIGRALINAVLRRRGSTTEVVVPVASGLVAHRDRYFGALTSYRGGDIAPLISLFAAHAGVLRPLTSRKRNQVWGAGLILDELEDLSDRIATTMG
ncbi:MAG: Fic family protein [Microthrixaceae bacterium]